MQLLIKGEIINMSLTYTHAPAHKGKIINSSLIYTLAPAHKGGTF